MNVWCLLLYLHCPRPLTIYDLRLSSFLIPFCFLFCLFSLPYLCFTNSLFVHLHFHKTFLFCILCCIIFCFVESTKNIFRPLLVPLLLFFFILKYRFHDLIGGIHVPVDDGVDKLNRKYTLLVFLFLALPIFTKQYIGDPIECFTPTYFTEPQARYVNSYCWTASTYYLVAADADDEDYDIVGQVGKNQVCIYNLDYWF